MLSAKVCPAFAVCWHWHKAGHSPALTKSESSQSESTGAKLIRKGLVIACCRDAIEGQVYLGKLNRFNWASAIMTNLWNQFLLNVPESRGEIVATSLLNAMCQGDFLTKI